MFKKLFDPTYKEFLKCEAIADKVLKLEEEYKKLSDEELQHKTIDFKKLLEEGKTLDDVVEVAKQNERLEVIELW